MPWSRLSVGRTASDRGALPPSSSSGSTTAALLRGGVEDDELCEIVGVGPVSVKAIQEMALEEDPFWTAVVTKGHDGAGETGPEK